MKQEKEITERIETFEDALMETGRPDVPEFNDIPEDLRAYFKAQYKAVVINEALNEVWKPDWSDRDQIKWIPYFDSVSPSGFAFYDSIYRSTNPYAGTASRLCFKTSTLAEYAGKQFLDIWKDLILK